MSRAETSVIEKIGIHATAATAVPTLPDKDSGTPMTMTGFVTIGSRDKSHDADLNEDSLTVPFARDDAVVDPPLGLAAADHIQKKAGAIPFEFTCYDAAEALFALDSDISITTHVASMDTTRTKRAVLIEVAGKYVDYFPQCVVQVMEGSVGGGEAGTTKVLVSPEGTSTVPGGWQRHWYQPAVE